MLDVLLAAANCLLHLSGHSLVTRSGHVATTESAAGLGLQHLSDIHSWQLLSKPWGLQIAKHPPIHQWGYCAMVEELLGRVLVFIHSLENSFTFFSICVVSQQVFYDPVLSGQKSNQLPS